MKCFDVAVIGAGVVGCAVARELSRYSLSICVLEKELDVACGNSGRNTGMLHAGFTYRPGSLKAECAVEGNREFDQVAEELDIPFKRTGKLVVGFDEKDRKNILKYKAIGEENGVRGMEMIDKKRLNEIDPNAGGEFAMYVPSSGILDPMQYTIAPGGKCLHRTVRNFFLITGSWKLSAGMNAILFIHRQRMFPSGGCLTAQECMLRRFLKCWGIRTIRLKDLRENIMFLTKKPEKK